MKKRNYLLVSSQLVLADGMHVYCFIYTDMCSPKDASRIVQICRKMSMYSVLKKLYVLKTLFVIVPACKRDRT
jgi:hypothetical protein